ncbi:neuraminidase-like domain-containing protein [Sphingobacterium humi]|nr:neuraminidase-like domain-containing protein [Sphingobacterium humi]
MTGVDVRNLQDIMLFLIDKGDIVFNPGFHTAFLDERDNSTYGSATSEYIYAFRNAKGILPVSGNVDGPTAVELNALYDQYPPEPEPEPAEFLKVYGYIRHISGNQLPEVYDVTIKQVLFSSALSIGTTQQDEYGYYSCDIDKSTLSGQGPNYVVQVFVDDTPIELASSDKKGVSYIDNEVRIDIMLDNDISIASEYLTLKTKIEDVIQPTPIKNLTFDGEDSNAAYIATVTEESRFYISLMIQAFQLSDRLEDLNPELIYGLFRMNKPVLAEQLIFQPDQNLLDALQIAMDTTIIGNYSQAALNDFVAALKARLVSGWNNENASDTLKSSTFKIFNKVFSNAALTNGFMALYFGYEDEEDFWDFIGTHATYGTYKDRLKAITEVSPVSGSNPALAGRMLELLEGGTYSGSKTLPVTPNVMEPDLLAILTLTDWQTLVTECASNDAANFYYPDYIEGENNTERNTAYAKRLFENFAVIYPTRSFDAMIAGDANTAFSEMKLSLNSFIGDNPGFDIRTVDIRDLSSPSSTYDFTGVNDREAFIDEVAITQRLMGLTSLYPAVSAMAADGLVSAFHVSRMSSADFVDTYSDKFNDDAELAESVYASAGTITAHSVTRTLQYQNLINVPNSWDGIGSHIPNYVDQTAIPYPGTPPANDPYAEWRSLFGSLDACTCCHCQSLYSPSAYLVDTLHFFKTKAVDVHNRLVNDRRPDIRHIELTCENTNTPLPQIDIVNELLEDIVSTGNYEVYARQTTADAAHLRAVPEHINADGVTITNGSTTKTLASPYTKLKAAQYPWSLPYNFYQRQIAVHLDIAGVKSWELAQRFSKQDVINAWSTYQNAVNYAGAPNELAQIITTSSPVTPPNNASLAIFYGFITGYTHGSNTFRANIPDPRARGTYLAVNSTDWIQKLVGRVDVFLQQTKLTYKELLHLLDCYFLNPVNPADPQSRILAIMPNDQAQSPSTCKLHELKISPYNFNTDIPVFLDKLHRFVRLAKALGWQYYRLDKVLRTLGSTNIDQTIFTKVMQVRRLADLYKVSPELFCTLYADLDTALYRDYGKENEECEVTDIPNQYLTIFRNPAMKNVIENGNYPFKADHTAITNVSKADLTNYLSGILQLSTQETQTLLDEAYNVYNISTDPFIPSLSFLSYLCRQNILIKALKISVKDWQHYMKWISQPAYFGNKTGTTDPANDTAARPISIFNAPSANYTALPFDTLRFAHVVSGIKDTELRPQDTDYILLDQPVDALSDDKANIDLAQKLAGLRNELSKSWYPAFDAVDDNAGLELKAILLTILTEGDAEKLLEILNRVLDITPEYNSGDRTFINDDLSFFLPPNADLILADDSDSNYLDNTEDRYNYVYDNYCLYLNEQVLKPAVSNYLATSYRLDAGTTHFILDKVVYIGNDNGFDILLDADFITGTDPLERWDPANSASDQFRVILYLHKASILVNAFRLSLTEVQYLWYNKLDAAPTEYALPDILRLMDLPIRNGKTDTFLPGTDSDATYRLLRNFLQWMRIRVFTGSDITILFDAVRKGTTSLSPVVAQVMKMSASDTAALLDIPVTSSTDTGILGIDPALSYTLPLTYLRIMDCLEMQYLMPAAMGALDDVATAAISAAVQADASVVIHLVRAPYNNTQWLSVIEPVNDKLRVERRDALLAFMLAYPPSNYYNNWLTSHDIYETMMVDVEMMPVVSTTRILLANNTIQLWIDRVLLQLESVTLTNTLARQWYQWRRIYRLWEANRKIFLYPENWIEPELRDNKSPFFLELENFLKQNEINKDTVEEAYNTYLERLEQVSSLNVIGIYRETNDTYNVFNPDNNDVVHVFARTRSVPYIYFYRKRVAREWTAWEKMDIEISSDHFIPVMWRGRLKLYWLEFTKDQETKGLSDTRRSDVGYVTPPKVRWRIQLGWTELKDNKWTPKEISSEALYSNFIAEETPVDLDQLPFFHLREMSNRENRQWNKEGDLELIRKESFNFFCSYDASGRPQFRVVERNYALDNAVMKKIYNDHYYIIQTSPLVRFRVLKNPIDSLKAHFDKAFQDWNQQFKWSSDEVVTNGMFELTPRGVVAIQKGNNAANSIIYDDLYNKPNNIDLYNNAYWPANTDYWYNLLPGDGYSHFPDNNIKLLKYAPGNTYKNDPFDGSVILKYPSISNPNTTYLTPPTKRVVVNKEKAKYIVLPRVVPENYSPGSKIEIPYFFYKDKDHTFFVEKGIISLTPQVTVSNNNMASPGIMPVHTAPASVQMNTVKNDNSGFSSIGLSGVFSASANSGASVQMSGYPVNVSPSASPGGSNVPVTALPGVTAYRFHNFTFSRIDDFLDILHAKGTDGLLDLGFTGGFTDRIQFDNVYQPTGSVDPRYPDDTLDFSPEGAYSLYNWELFYHIPIFIANKLSQDQQFDDARRWYHYVFNPTNKQPSGSTANPLSRFWNFKPFYDNTNNIPTIADVLADPSVNPAIAKWAENPFNPHSVARTRLSAYMKNTVNKYLDNLIAWGDVLFRRDTRESINEATLLYVLAAQILGRRPQEIPARAQPQVQTYYTLSTQYQLNDFGNAMVKIENYLLSSGATKHSILVPSSTKVSRPTSGTPAVLSNSGATVFTNQVFTGANFPVLANSSSASTGNLNSSLQLTIDEAQQIIGNMYYFCIPFNDKMLQYWDILADRLFKIRNSQNIDGITRTLALFDPPIDPALLVRAAASGASLSDILGDLNAPLPNYRFNTLSAKATELAAEVKGLGSLLLTALEKKDAEHIALLRSTQELNVLNAMTDLRKLQVEEAQQQLDALSVQLETINVRRDHFQNLIDEGLIGGEQTQLISANIGTALTAVSASTSVLAATTSLFPNLTIGAFSFGTHFGGENLGKSGKYSADAIGILAAMNNHIAHMAGLNAGFKRRQQDWELQVKTATIEIKQVEKLLVAAEIRKAMADKELANHILVVANSEQMDTAMRDKYTNEQLYEWMVTQISLTYFQAYKLAYDTAKKAEKCFRYELNLTTSDYIRYGYWDSLKKGLLAGESLMYDIKRMEVAYLDKHKRQLELTKHISLASLNPDALIALRLGTECQIELPEWLYDMDYPGQHMRRIKSVSISIPCVAGPYTTISCKLTQTSSKYRHNGSSGASYEEDTDNDSRFTYMYGNIQSVATSRADQDSGLFELNFRDERYLPFEGTGAISKWTIELPAAYAQFDYNTIQDVILHINYTAQDSGATKAAARTYVEDVIKGDTDGEGLYRIFDLKNEFPDAWKKMLADNSFMLSLDDIKARLPYLVQGLDISDLSVTIFTDKKFDCRLTSIATPPDVDPKYDISAETASGSGQWKAILRNDITGADISGTVYLHVKEGMDITNVGYCWMVMQYKAE